MADEGGVALAGAVAIEVTPDARGFYPKLKAQVVPAADAVGRDLARGMSAPIAREVGEKVRDGVRDGGRAAQGQATRTGADIGADMGRAIKTRLEVALKNLPAAKLDGDDGPLTRKLAAVRAKMEALRKVTVGVDMDATEFNARAAQVRNEVNSIIRRVEKLRDEGKVEIPVDLDAFKAFAEMSLLQREIGKLSRERPTVHVDVDVDDGGSEVVGARLAEIGAKAAGAGQGISGLVAVGLTMIPALIPVAAAAAAAIGAIGPAAVVGGAGLGVVALGLSGVIGAVSQMGKANESAGAGASQHASKLAAVASAADQLKSAEAGLANTRANAADSTRRAEQGLATAERTLAQAQIDAKRAQEALTGAREDARRSLEDMNAAVRHGALDQRAALLDFADSQRNLDAVMVNPNSDNGQRQRAQLAFEEAKQRLEDVNRQQQRNVADADKANKAGVEGSSQVVAANQKIADTQEAVRKATEGLTEARIAEATTARQNAFSIAQATQSVTSAQRSLAQAMQQTNESGSAGANKLKDALAGLSPVGRHFAEFLYSLKPVLGELRRAAEVGLLPGVEAGLRALLTIKDPIVVFIGRLATVMGTLFEMAGKALASPFWINFFDLIGQQAGPILIPFAQALGQIIEGFASLILAFVPVTEKMGPGLLGMTTAFANWAAGLSKSRGFQSFLDYVAQNGPIVMDVLKQAWIFGERLVVALAPLGGPILSGVRDMFGALNKIPIPVLRDAAIAVGAIVIGLKAAAVAAKLWDIAVGIAEAVTAVFTAELWGMAAAFLATPIGWLVIGIGLLVAAVIYAWTHFEGFRKVVIAAWDGIKIAASFAWNNVLKPIFGFLRDVIMVDVVPAVLWLWHNVLEPAFSTIAALASWWWNEVLSPIFSGLVFVIRNFVVPIFLFLYEHVVKPVFSGIVLAIRIAWAIIEVVFGLIVIGLKILAAPFVWLYEHIVRPMFGAIADTISDIWTNRVKPILTVFGGFIEQTVAPIFRKGVDALGKAWDFIVDKLRTPVRIVIDKVLNQGLLKGYNLLAHTFNVKPDDVKIPLDGFHDGGIVPGYSPGVDTHVVAVGGGEGILRPEVTRALGPSTIHAWNAAARAGRLTGYASGGVVGDNSPSRIGGFFGDVADAILHPIDYIKNLIKGPIDELRATLGGSSFGKALIGLPAKLLHDGADYLKSLIGIGAGPGQGANPAAFGGPAGTTYPALIGLARASGIPFTVSDGGTYRPGDPGYHGKGEAVDMWDSAGNMVRLAQWFMRAAPDMLEIIHSGGGGYFVKNGGRVGPGYYGPATVAAHFNHVHVAANPQGVALATALLGGGQAKVYDQGGWLRPGDIGINLGNRPEPVFAPGELEQLTAGRSTSSSASTTNHYEIKTNAVQLDIGQLQALQARQDALARVGRPR